METESSSPVPNFTEFNLCRSGDSSGLLSHAANWTRQSFSVSVSVLVALDPAETDSETPDYRGSVNNTRTAFSLALAPLSSSAAMWTVSLPASPVVSS